MAYNNKARRTMNYNKTQRAVDRDLNLLDLITESPGKHIKEYSKIMNECYSTTLNRIRTMRDTSPPLIEVKDGYYIFPAE